jgi:hypothetical protein
MSVWVAVILTVIASSAMNLGLAVKPPEGVTEIEYVSGELRLKAWVVWSLQPPTERFDPAACPNARQYFAPPTIRRIGC